MEKIFRFPVIVPVPTKQQSELQKNDKRSFIFYISAHFAYCPLLLQAIMVHTKE